MKNVQIKISYNRSIFVPVEHFSALMKELGKCQIVDRESVCIDGEYKEFHKLANIGDVMEICNGPNLVDQFPESDYAKERRLKEEAEALEAQKVDALDQALQEVMSDGSDAA